MDTGVSWMMVIVALCVVLYFTHKQVLAALYWLVATLSQLTYGALDHFFLANLLPTAPWITWLFWGAVIGAAFGLWTQAPLYGWRKYRPYILIAPFVLIGIVALIGHLLAQ